MKMKSAALAGTALLFMCATAFADVKETEEMSFDVSSGARISVENINGDIRVTGGSGDKVNVIARKKAGEQEYMDKLKVLVDAETDYIRIETKHPKSEDGWFKWVNDSSELEK